MKKTLFLVGIVFALTPWARNQEATRQQKAALLVANDFSKVKQKEKEKLGLTTLLVLALAVRNMGIQSIKAALVKPANSLRAKGRLGREVSGTPALAASSHGCVACHHATSYRRPPSDW